MGAPNTNPIYSLTPNVSAGQLTPSTTANTKSDGAGTIGTDMIKCFTAGAAGSNAAGSQVSSIRLQCYATVANTATTATTIRLYISSKTSGVTTNADTFCFQEVSVGSQNADHSTLATFPIEVPVNKSINNAYTILASIHAAPAANTGWQVEVYGGDY